MTSSNGSIFRVTGPLYREFAGPGEFSALRPVTRSFDVFFDLCLNKRLSKQSWGWWFETPSRPLWRQRNDNMLHIVSIVHTNHVYFTLCERPLEFHDHPEVSLQWRHNERDGVSNHRRVDCLFIRLFRYRLKKASKLCINGLYERNPPVTGGFPSEGPANTKNVSIWSRHHVV